MQELCQNGNFSFKGNENGYCLYTLEYHELDHHCAYGCAGLFYSVYCSAILAKQAGEQFLMDYIPINWSIIANPVNWVVIVLMVLIAGYAFHILAPKTIAS